jgi:FAD:protein FMN transferase
MDPCLPPLSVERPLEAARENAWPFHADGVLGTRLDVIVEGGGAEAAFNAAQAAEREIRRLDQCLSRHREDSELALLNRSSLLAVSSDLFKVLTQAARWRFLVEGAFDERLGAVSQLWRASAPDTPDPVDLLRVAKDARSASIALDPARLLVHRDEGAVIDLDAFAKGYIIDRALAEARKAARDASGILIGIGGDGAGWRADRAGQAWSIGLPQAEAPADNAPLAAVMRFSSGGYATSGRGPRDVMAAGRRIGPTLSPISGEPAGHTISATVFAPCAADADALATIALSLPPVRAIALIETLPGVAGRIVDGSNTVWTSNRWREETPLAIPVQASPSRTQPARPATPSAPTAEVRWPIDWRLEFFYTAPERQAREADFRAPYMALWISDARNRPIRTLYMVGRESQWQKDNFIWWSAYRTRAEKIIDLRSESTVLDGRYAVLWYGRDDDEKKIPPGKYIVHLETSRERGIHTHRTMEIEIGNERFDQSIPNLPQAGGFRVKFGHPNDEYDRF